MADSILSSLRNLAVTASDSDEDIMKEVVRNVCARYLYVHL